MLATADPGGSRGVDLSGTLIFDALGPDGREIWRADGTTPGTFMIKEIAVGSIFSSTPQWLTLMNGEVYFAADEVGPESDALWKTDGTEAGTVKVVDVDPVDFSTSGGPSNLVNAAGTLFFLANSDQANGRELWKTDGTAGGTAMVKDIEADLVNEANNFTSVGSRLFFTFEGAEGKELWTSDGTGAGTKIVEDINPGPSSGLASATVQRVEEYVEFDGSLFFRADDGDGFELWRSDGTPAGTFKVKDINGGPGGSMGFNPWFATLGDELFFATDFEFYKTDGTGPGTVEVKDFVPDPTDTTAVGGALYFRDVNTLYKSDGTAAGTDVVGVLDGQPLHLTDFNGTLYFGMDDGVFGQELWRSDGTLAGTERLTDLNPAGGSLVNELTVSGDHLYFRGDDGSTGVELWQAYSDVTPPETTIDSGPGEGETIETDSATFTFSSNETGASFDCTLDAGPPEECDSGTITYSGLAEGPHTFSVAATDPGTVQQRRSHPGHTRLHVHGAGPT